MMIVREKTLVKGWRVALVEDVDRNRYIEVYDDKGKFIQSISPSHKMYDLFLTILDAP